MLTVATPLRPAEVLERIKSRASAVAVDALCVALLVGLSGCCLAGSLVVGIAHAVAGAERPAITVARRRLQAAGWRGRSSFRGGVDFSEP